MWNKIFLLILIFSSKIFSVTIGTKPNLLIKLDPKNPEIVNCILPNGAKYSYCSTISLKDNHKFESNIQAEIKKIRNKIESNSKPRRIGFYFPKPEMNNICSKNQEVVNNQFTGQVLRLESTSDFEKIVFSAPESCLILVKFDSLLPSTSEFEQTFNELSMKYKDKILFISVDVDESKFLELAKKYQISRLPIFLIFKNGFLIEQIDAVNLDKLISCVEKFTNIIG